MSTTNLTITRGDTATYTLTFTDVDTGTRVSLSGMTVRWVAKRGTGDTDAGAVIVKSSAVGGGITIDADPTTGRAYLTILPADTASITKSTTLIWDAQIASGSTIVRTAMVGQLEVVADVTRTAP